MWLGLPPSRSMLLKTPAQQTCAPMLGQSRRRRANIKTALGQALINYH